MDATATHRPINMSGRFWVENGRRAAFESVRPGFAVQVIATGEVLAKDGVTPSVWITKAVAKIIAETPLDWPTVKLI